MRVFIGSSTESKDVAGDVKLILEHYGVTAKIWYDTDIFVGSKSTLENLNRAATNVDAALFIWTDDDIEFSKRGIFYTTRDNVILETGLFMGRLGTKCVGICKKRDVKLPSDLLGFTTISIDNITKLKQEIGEWLQNINHESLVVMNSRTVIDIAESLEDRWKYAKEVLFVNYSASIFLIPYIASDAVYKREHQFLFMEKMRSGTLFKFIIVRPNSWAAKEAIKNKMKIMASQEINKKDVFAMSLESLNTMKATYSDRLQYRTTDIALPYAAMQVINDDEHKYLDHIKIDLYSPLSLDSERRSFIVKSGSENYNFFSNNIIEIWNEAK